MKIKNERCIWFMKEKSRNNWFEYAEQMSMGHWTLAPINPRSTIHVNPLEITQQSRYHIRTKERRGSKLYDFGRVIDGDWDLGVDGKRNTVLENTRTHLSVYERYLQGKSWVETPVWAQKMALIKATGKVDNCRNETELAQRYEELDLVFHDIATNGWKPLPLQISVSLTRGGGMLLAESGSHRLAIAKLLRIPTIEVYVMTRHKQWQDLRERVAREECLFEFATLNVAGSNHPDLAPYNPCGQGK